MKPKREIRWFVRGVSHLGKKWESAHKHNTIDDVLEELKIHSENNQNELKIWREFSLKKPII